MITDRMSAKSAVRRDNTVPQLIVLVTSQYRYVQTIYNITYIAGRACSLEVLDGLWVIQ